MLNTGSFVYASCWCILEDMSDTGVCVNCHLVMTCVCGMGGGRAA